MNFDTCIRRLRQAHLLVDASSQTDTEFDRLVIDSREAGPSDCFVALKGRSVDGHLFIDKAVKNGASAIVCEAGPDTGPAYARVKDSRRALAELASLKNDDPGNRLELFAVTGTNGKTTVATLVKQVLEMTGNKTGFIGTTGYQDGTGFYEATHTTPSPIRVYELLRQMRAAGCSHCAMELSSHAIDQHRIRFTDVNVALFTNLTREHLDYHHTIKAYQAVKKMLFDEMPRAGVAITNLDDPFGRNIVAGTGASVLTYGVQHSADISCTIESNELSGLELTLDGHRRSFQLAGTYNASNLTAAYAACISLGLPAKDAIDALANCAPVEGRFERLCFDSGITVIVDYAHTPDALENVLQATRQSMRSEHTLWCIFGCGGDRDRGKRPQMGEIAERLANRVIVTNDNPRTEPIEQIFADIRAGFKKPGEAFWIEERRLAIEKAASMMGPTDTLVLAGKGHETYQVIGTENIHFDDRDEAGAAFGAQADAQLHTRGG